MSLGCREIGATLPIRYRRQVDVSTGEVSGLIRRDDWHIFLPGARHDTSVVNVFEIAEGYIVAEVSDYRAGGVRLGCYWLFPSLDAAVMFIVTKGENK